MNKSWLRSTIRSFEPYKVPEIKENIVINANESPYNIFDFPAVKADFLARLAQTPSYHYPDPFAEELRAALADYVSCKPEEVLVGNGGDEIIDKMRKSGVTGGLLKSAARFGICITKEEANLLVDLGKAEMIYENGAVLTDVSCYDAKTGFSNNNKSKPFFG